MKLAMLVGEIEETLDELKKQLESTNWANALEVPDSDELHNMEGWVEALEYVLKRIEVLY